MSAAHHSTTDLAEAELVGSEAARLALAGASDRMVTLVRRSNRPYRCEVGTAPLAAIANRQRALPAAFIGNDGVSVTPAFRRYALPLLGEPLPRLAEPL
jgi:6-phosphofructokinase 1